MEYIEINRFVPHSWMGGFYFRLSTRLGRKTPEPAASASPSPPRAEGAHQHSSRAEATRGHEKPGSPSNFVTKRTDA